MRPYVKVVFMVLLLLLALSLVFFGMVAYTFGYHNGELFTRKQAIVKEPRYYEIWKHYSAEKLQGESIDWNTTEELGVVFIKSRSVDYYDVYIFDEEKALPWMNITESQLKVVKYGDELYRIRWLWVSPGVPGPNWLVPIGLFLGACWILTGIGFLKLRKKE